MLSLYSKFYTCKLFYKATCDTTKSTIKNAAWQPDDIYVATVSSWVTRRLTSRPIVVKTFLTATVGRCCRFISPKRWPRCAEKQSNDMLYKAYISVQWLLCICMMCFYRKEMTVKMTRLLQLKRMVNHIDGSVVQK